MKNKVPVKQATALAGVRFQDEQEHEQEDAFAKENEKPVDVSIDIDQTIH